MGTVYALFVGIDDYPLPHRSLRGAVNDVEAAARLLGMLGEGAFETRFLRNAEATTDAVVAAVRDHLGAAGPGDTALFWFSGHGTDYAAVLPLHLRTEATGRYQALVCADSPRQGGRPLVDKELGALLDAVAARGAHVAAVLDCCFSGGATRRLAQAGLTARYAPPAPWWGEPLDGRGPTAGSGTTSAARHVLLAAGRLNELSYERDFDGVPHGVFTHALLDALRAAGPGATYRDLLAAAHCQVRTERADQHPVLFPPEPGGVADQPFLGGAVTRARGPHLLRNGPHGWEVDCGRVHGLRSDDPDGTEFTVTEPGAAPRLVRARSVHTDRTEVDPAGWEPDRRRVYPVALSALALPPTRVAVETPDGSAAARGAARSIREAVGSAGPGGGPTPLLRLVDGAGSAPGHLLRVVVSAESGTGLAAHLLRRDGSAAVPPLPLGGPQDARRVAGCLAHLTRWHQLLTLDNPSSPLADLVRVEIRPWTYDGPWSSDGPSPLLPDGGGEIVCRYGRSPSGGPQEPWLSVRLHNRSATRTLWCVLLNLTDGYAGHTGLYPGHFIGPGRTGFALDDRPVVLTVPAHRARPGAQVRDWLKLIVAERELNTVPFHLPPWDPENDGFRLSRLAGADGMLRLTSPAGSDRDMGPAHAWGPGQWTTRTIPLRTVIPSTG
ncbi:caspase family protein [Streptomyces sp. NPDC006458]|uniref:caspase family protein n=1 Tax=Streptomyces sp. NPDC006458 TaxID=3154302 RepID=UPI0033A2D1F7